MLKTVADTVVKPVLLRYLKKERGWRYRGFSLRIFPGVFHPRFFFSSKYLFGFVGQQELKGKHCLEIGCGSGLISLLMARKGGTLTAVDISQEAVRNTRLNFELNKAALHPGYRIMWSDLFSALPGESFDLIVVNPPYFFKEVTSESQYAWNCGAGGEYFSALFGGLRQALRRDGKVYMVLADNCDIERITGLAREHDWKLRECHRQRIWWEENFIFAVEPIAP